MTLLSLIWKCSNMVLSPNCLLSLARSRYFMSKEYWGLVDQACDPSTQEDGRGLRQQDLEFQGSLGYTLR